VRIKKIDHLGIVVDDLAAAKAFFVDFGFELKGETSVEGQWADRVNGLKGTNVDIAMLQAPNGQIDLELNKFHAPPDTTKTQNLPSNAVGFRHIAFIVDDVEAEVARLKTKGIELVDEIVNYKNIYKLCYVRGPENIIVELAEALS
jgi:catechol 2,3-dioxygenase-like lactoylglutathione lyase family enzyme